VRVTHDVEDVGEVIAGALAADAWPGIFSGGKQITATQSYKRQNEDVFQFRFNDGSVMTFIGRFRVQYKHKPTEEENQLMLGMSDAEE
jgi:hypothetical protein